MTFYLFGFLHGMAGQHYIHHQMVWIHRIDLIAYSFHEENQINKMSYYRFIHDSSLIT